MSSIKVTLENGRAPQPILSKEDWNQAHPKLNGSAPRQPFPLPVIGNKAQFRSFEQLNLEEGSAEHRQAVEREFPMGAAELTDGVGRRSFLQLLGASLATLGLEACTYAAPAEKILPYNKPPDGVLPGLPQHYASASVLGGFATGLLVKSYEGRPTKVEGSSAHPYSLGASGLFEQASILDLYDPQRARSIREGKEARTWKGFLLTLNQQLTKLEVTGGAGLRFLLEPTSSPLGASLRERILKRFPKSKFYSYAPFAPENEAEGTQIAFGEPLQVDYNFEKAAVVLSLDSDFLAALPNQLRYAHDFTRHRDGEGEGEMNRLYVAETSLSVTGGFADNRLRLKPSDIANFAIAIASELSVGGPPPTPLDDKQTKWAKAVARDLLANRGKSLIVAGFRQPAEIHALVHAMNSALGNLGETVLLRKPVLSDSTSGPRALKSLVSEIQQGQVDTLLITAYNPVYAAPKDFDLASLLPKVPNVIYWGAYDDETSQHTRWFLPAAHPLEAWGDARAIDGSISFVQPLIRPLFHGINSIDVLAAFVDDSDPGAHAHLKSFWKGKHSGSLSFEAEWDGWLAEGMVANSNYPTEKRVLQVDQVRSSIQRHVLKVQDAAKNQSAGSFEVNLIPDYKVYDGRFANNAWLQEIPDPMTKVTWDNAALLSRVTAEKLGVQKDDVVILSYRGQTLEASVFILPGHADQAVTLALGYGRTGGEAVARNAGFNAYALQFSDALWFGPGLSVSKTHKKYPLANTQEHWTMDGRALAIETRIEDFEKNPKFLETLREPLPSLYAPVPYEGYKWGMAIDLSRCTGCTACVVACQSENNIPVVGKEGVSRTREMHWLRIDRYFSSPPGSGGPGDESPKMLDDPSVISQPVACVHCENAPCEYVCPVNATVHSDEGLNDMVYNRCIGTRYCANNCPYKVRRFNFLAYNTKKSATEKMLMNPDVTVRARGVMEKCTYCVQRIEQKRIQSRIEGRKIAGGELKTACQQACPTTAIVFGDLNDSASEVSKLKASERRYNLLHNLNTNPRTGYLARLKNPNPELA